MRACVCVGVLVEMCIQFTPLHGALMHHDVYVSCVCVDIISVGLLLACVYISARCVNESAPNETRDRRHSVIAMDSVCERGERTKENGK